MAEQLQLGVQLVGSDRPEQQLEPAGAASVGSGAEGAGPGAAPGFYQSFDLAGEAIAQRIGFGRVACAPSGESDGWLPSSAQAGPEPAPAAGVAAGDASGGLLGSFSLAAARRLPPTVLTSSCTDLTVPWFESAEQYWLLHDCGVPARHLVYNKVPSWWCCVAAIPCCRGAAGLHGHPRYAPH